MSACSRLHAEPGTSPDGGQAVTHGCHSWSHTGSEPWGSSRLSSAVALRRCLGRSATRRIRSSVALMTAVRQAPGCHGASSGQRGCSTARPLLTEGPLQVAAAGRLCVQSLGVRRAREGVRSHHPRTCPLGYMDSFELKVIEEWWAWEQLSASPRYLVPGEGTDLTCIFFWLLS